MQEIIETERSYIKSIKLLVSVRRCRNVATKMPLIAYRSRVRACVVVLGATARRSIAHGYQGYTHGV